MYKIKLTASLIRINHLLVLESRAEGKCDGCGGMYTKHTCFGYIGVRYAKLNIAVTSCN